MAIQIGATPISTLMLGTSQIYRAYLGVTIIWDSKVIVVLGPGSSIVFVNFFTPEVWANERIDKLVINPAGNEIAAFNATYAIAPTGSAQGQAGSWAGMLTFENRGTVSGMGGAANSGKGGDVIWMNFPGRAGQKMQIINTGTIRAGGGGGGLGGNGGGGVWYDYQNSGVQYNKYVFHWEHNFNGANATGILKVWVNNGVMFEQRITDVNYANLSAGGWNYQRQQQIGNDGGWRLYAMSRQLITPNPVYTSGGAGGWGGRGWGCDGGNAGGNPGAGGGTNAGSGGYGGTGADYGGTGGAGASGNGGNNGGGTSGAAGGLPGFYLNGAANANMTNTGTLQGRVA